MPLKIAYQGEPGANSHIACIEAYPTYEPMPCGTFEDAFQAVTDGEAALAMIPIDNSVAGRVADIHHLLPRSNLYIIGEHFLPVHHQLMVVPGADRSEIRVVRSHVHALGQCRKVIRELGLKPVVAADTAGAARELSRVARVLAGRHRLEARRRDLWPRGDPRGHRGREPQHHALRRALRHPAGCRAGGHAGHHHLRLPCTERSRRALQGDGRLRHQWRQHDQARILPDRGPVLGHPVLCRHRRPSVGEKRRLAMEELEFFTSYLRVLGIYKASPHRAEIAKRFEKV